MKLQLKKVIAGLALILPAFTVTNAHAIPVDLELSLVIDMSGSVDGSEFLLQKNGYRDAFNSASVQNAIQALGNAGTGGIAVNVIYFGGTASQQIGWTQLQSAADAASFATALDGLTDLNLGNTNIAKGMETGIASILTNGFEGSRLVMDVSGDGKQNVLLNSPFTGCGASCTGLVENQRDQAATAGIRVNGLAIIDDYADLNTYYSNHVRTAGGFVYDATFATFGTAVYNKIYREITNGVPEPASLALMGLGLIGMGAARRRKAA